MKKNLFKLFISKLLDYPLWVKQAIFRKLYRDMEENDSAKEVILSPEKIYALYEPVLTFDGENELNNKKGWLDANICNFLKLCRENYNLLEISLNTFLSLEETSKIFMLCIEQKYIEKPDNKMIYAVCGFLSGKFRTGEYFLNKGSLTEEQLEDALKLASASNKPTGEILCTKGLVTKDEIRRLFIFKTDSKKRFILNSSIYPESKLQVSGAEKYESEIEALTTENKRLKKRMQQILKLVSMKDETDA